MDPMSAFGLAVNILTVIDLVVKVISAASEIRSHGESITTSDRAAVAQHLESLCDRLIESSKAISKNSGNYSQAVISSEDDAALYRLAEEARAIAQDIQQGLVRRQKGQALLKTLRDAVLSVWGEREMTEKTQRLKEMRAEIQFELMVSIKASVDAAALRGDQSLQKLDDATQKIIGTLLSDNDTIRSDLERRVADLNQFVLSHLDRDAFLAGRRHDELLSAIAGSSVLAMTAVAENQAQITERILGRLWFPRMNDRYDDIDPAHEKTFEWIFSRDVRLHSSSNFIEWIEDDRGVYWMSGRAGSGKSTLMKFMADDPRTKMLFQTWARGQPLVTAKYLFWDQGSDILQKSLDGLFRGILHDIIGKETSFAPLLFPDQFKEANGWSEEFPTSNELKRAFERLVSLESSSTKVAILIDGLDEYSAPRGLQHDLAETLKRAAHSKHMKIIASSRPETVFEKSFVDCEKLYLHDLTYQDRTLFVSDKLFAHQRTSYLMTLPDGNAEMEHLICSTVERSEGIFLWLRLVVEALVQELDVCESVGELPSILTQFPRGLERLFLHMMRRMLKENERRGFECLWIMRHSLRLQHKRSPYERWTRLRPLEAVNPNAKDNKSIRLTAFCMDGAQMPLDAVLKTKVGPLSSAASKDTLKKVENRLRSWCAGLLELKDAPSDDESQEPGVAFIHRSVSEFLDLAPSYSDLADELTKTSFDVNFMLMKGLLVNLKREGAVWDYNPAGRLTIFAELIMRLSQFVIDDRQHEANALLSELDRSMTLLIGARRRHWTCYFPWVTRNDTMKISTPFKGTPRSSDFLSVAVENGLQEFVLHTLGKPEIRRSVKATIGAPLLNAACRPPPFSIVIPGTIRPAIIHRLLDLGADPNKICLDGFGTKTTPWESMLKTVSDLGILTIEGARQFAEILTAMINHGADQHARIHTHIITLEVDMDSSYFPEAMVTAPQATEQNDWKAQFELRPRDSALSKAQMNDPTDSEKDYHTVRGIIYQSFITKPLLRRHSHGSKLPGKFVPFEEIDSTWEIKDHGWGKEYGASYPDNSHPPKLSSSERESIKGMGFALLQLLEQNKSTRHADSQAVQDASVKQPKTSKLDKLHTIKAELLARLRRTRN